MRIVFERAGAALVARVVELPGLTGCPEEIEFGVECPTEWSARLLLERIVASAAVTERAVVSEAYERGYQDGRKKRGRNNPNSTPTFRLPTRKAAKKATKKSVARRA